MGRQRICLALLAIVATTIAKPPPMAGGPPPWAAFAGKSASPWAAYGAFKGPAYAPPYPPPFASPFASPYASPYASFGAGKTAFTRSLGPAAAPAMSTITVPYGPKASPFFPKFVDPQAMIAKKTDMLANLFGGLGPVSYPSFNPLTPAAKPVLYAPEAPAKDPQALLAEKSVADEKRALFGPKMSPFSPFSPFSKFGPAPPKFGPLGPFGSLSDAPQFGASESGEVSRTKRAALGLGPESQTLGPPPAYPGLAPIPEESEELSSTPKQYLPMFGPFAPAGFYSPIVPFGPVVDPSIYITKKTAFLNALFNSLATSTPAPPGVTPDPLAPKSTIVPADFWLPFPTPSELTPLAPTDLPTPKSTIVPAGFWTPSSIIPGPTEYSDKVAVFLDKLFDSLKLNKTLVSSASSDDSKTLVARSIDDLQSITSAKDAILNSIIEEMSTIKTDMLSTMSDMIAAQKVTALMKPGKPGKPAKPLSPWALMFTPPTPDTTLPFQQKIASLSQVFDMLTGMQRNISKAIEETVKANSVTESPLAPVVPEDVEKMMTTLNATLLDAIKTKLDSLGKGPETKPLPGAWGPYAGYPGFYAPAAAVKRSIGDEELAGEGKVKRGVKMTMHQGYQSMPPGAFEEVQAGGGADAEHQGGGIKLFESSQNDYEEWGKQWADWAQNFRNQKDYRHHHH